MKTYRASLLGGDCLSIATDGDENEERAARPTALRVTSIEAGRVHLHEFYGESLRGCIDAAANALYFEYISLAEPCGKVVHQHLHSIGVVQSVEADFHATLGHSGTLHVVADEEDEQSGEPTSIAISMPDGQRQAFRGEGLWGCLRLAKKELKIKAISIRRRAAQ